MMPGACKRRSSQITKKPVGNGAKFSFVDQISLRLIGWGALAGATTEYVDPSILLLTSSQAAGLAMFGVIAATGSGKSILDVVRRLVKDD